MRHESMVYMIALSKYGSISAAAAACGIAQSSLSGHLQRLEKSMGCALFDRRGGELTPEGELYAATARDILRLQSELEQELQGLARPALRLGISDTIEKNLFTQAAAALLEALPKLDIHMSWGHMPPMLEQLRQLELDLLFGIDPGPGQMDIIYHEIMMEQLFFMLPKGYSTLESDCPRTLHELNFVILFRGSKLHKETECLLSGLKAQPIATLESNSYEVAHLLVRDSSCAAVVPASALPIFSDCAAIPLRLQIGSGFCFLRQLQNEAALRDVIRLFERAVRRICADQEHVHFTQRRPINES